MTEKLDELFMNNSELQLVVFKLGKEEYCVPIMSVQEIIMPLVPTKIPKSPDFVEGVINLRGHIIPVIDGCKKLNLGQNNTKSFESRIVILNTQDHVIGLIVDLVSEVIHLKKSDIEPPLSDFESKAEFLWGIGKYQNRLLILINPDSFLEFSELHEIKKAIKTINKVEEAKPLNVV